MSVTLQSGQLATTMTVINQGSEITTVQVRVMSWQQMSGIDQLTPSDTVLISPPIIAIAPGAKQVIRVVLRKPGISKENTYRILLDEIPSVAAPPGTVRIALSLSIPVFAEPATHVAPNVTFHVEKNATGAFLVGSNGGNSHETMHDMALTTGSGKIVAFATEGTPYILAGASRQWAITSEGVALIVPGTTLHLTAREGNDTIAREVPVVAATSMVAPSTRP